MNILIDTCIWSAALRKRATSETAPLISELKKLLFHGQGILPGIVRMEILSGLPNPSDFSRIRTELRKWEDFPVGSQDYESAAEMLTLCHSKGFQGSLTDFLLCTLAQRYDIPIFTTDKDFTHFVKYLPIKLHPIPE